MSKFSEAVFNKSDSMRIICSAGIVDKSDVQ